MLSAPARETEWKCEHAVGTKCCSASTAQASDGIDSDAGTIHVLLFVQQIVYNGQVNNEIQFALNGFIVRAAPQPHTNSANGQNFIH